MKQTVKKYIGMKTKFIKISVKMEPIFSEDKDSVCMDYTT